MVPYHLLIKLPGKIILPAMYATHAHYETDYHGLLLSRAP